MSISDHVWLLVAILGLSAVTFATRSFFLLTPAKFQFPSIIQRALRYAPSAAIVAVIAPSILMQNNAPDLSWHNHAFMATIAASIVFMWRQNLILMIMIGMIVFTVLRMI